jgi:hypothetical protein
VLAREHDHVGHATSFLHDKLKKHGIAGSDGVEE